MNNTPDSLAAQATAVPLVERLRSVPKDERLIIEEGMFATRFIAVGRMCHEAADALERQAVPDLAFQLLAAANYIEALGGDSRSYRQALASSPPAPAQPEPRCKYCDGTGDVHSIDGQWRGECKVCDAAQAAPSAPAQSEVAEPCNTCLSPKQCQTWMRCVNATPTQPSPVADEREARIKENMTAEDAIDELLTVACLSIRQPSETWYDALLRLIEWEVTMALDPAISSRAAALASQPTAPQGPMAATVEEAAADLHKWLNERPNRPIDLRHVAMLVHAVQAQPTAQGEPVPAVILNRDGNAALVQHGTEEWHCTHRGAKRLYAHHIGRKA